MSPLIEENLLPKSTNDFIFAPKTQKKKQKRNKKEKKEKKKTSSMDEQEGERVKRSRFRGGELSSISKNF